MNSNPPAFPIPDLYTNECIGISEGSTGMTLRDWFAGQAIQAVITATSSGQHHPGCIADSRPMPDRMADDAYGIADAMLAARKESKPCS